MLNIGSRMVSPNISGLISLRRLKLNTEDLLLHNLVRVLHLLDSFVQIFLNLRSLHGVNVTPLRSRFGVRHLCYFREACLDSR